MVFSNILYKEGDTVIVHDDVGNPDLIPGVNDKGEMGEYAGRVAKIVSLEGSGYRLDIDGGKWYWSDSMLLPNFKSEEEAFVALVRGEISKEHYEFIREKFEL